LEATRQDGLQFTLLLIAVAMIRVTWSIEDRRIVACGKFAGARKTSEPLSGRFRGEVGKLENDACLSGLPILYCTDLNTVIVRQRGLRWVALASRSPGPSISRVHRSYQTHSIAPHYRHQARHPIPLCDPIVKGSFSMSETKDISRQRLADFLAARLRARTESQSEPQRPRNESNSLASSRPDERTRPATES
jgi:hypothetical protein